MINPLKFIQSVKQEAFKVTWPGSKDVLMGSLMVFALATLAAIFFLLSKSDENQISLDCKKIDLKPLVEEVCKHAEVLAEEKNIKITIAFLEAVQVKGDEVRLRQMVWNILQNGIKYTQCGGELKISLQNYRKYALMIIQDTGIGIPKEDLGFIFNRFYRVDKARSRDEGGSGLGLSICRQIAEAHKGTIEVESKLGVGTRFKIRIPLIPNDGHL